MKTLLTSAMPEAWLFVLGGLFITVTLFLPRGIVGTIGWLLARRRRADEAAEQALTPRTAP